MFSKQFLAFQDSHDSRINDVQIDMGDVQNDMGDVQNDIVSITFSLHYNLEIDNLNLFFSYCILLLSSQN